MHPKLLSGATYMVFALGAKLNGIMTSKTYSVNIIQVYVMLVRGEWTANSCWPDMVAPDSHRFAHIPCNVIWPGLHQTPSSCSTGSSFVNSFTGTSWKQTEAISLRDATDSLSTSHLYSSSSRLVVSFAKVWCHRIVVPHGRLLLTSLRGCDGGCRLIYLIVFSIHECFRIFKGSVDRFESELLAISFHC